jgi:hypothetical protein
MTCTGTQIAGLLALACCSLALQAGTATPAPIVLVPGWTVASFAVIPASTPEGISVDGAGNVYVCTGSAGVYRVDSSGSVSHWSQAEGDGQATLPNGETYVPSRDIFSTRYIWHVMPDGSYSALTSKSTGEGWTWAAVSATGQLYAAIWAGSGEGIYAIDPVSGASTTLVTGGPGAGGTGYTGWYDGLATRGDSVFASGYNGSLYGVFLLRDSAFVPYAATTTELGGIYNGPDGIYGAGPDGTVWRVVSGSGTEFASGFGHSVGVAYDPGRSRFYVLDQYPQQIWVISRAPTPVQATSWGRLKADYR